MIYGSHQSQYYINEVPQLSRASRHSHEYEYYRLYTYQKYMIKFTVYYG